jgi:hypothetical protein
VASAEIGQVSRVAGAADGVVVVVVAVAVARETALWARRQVTAVPKAAATERLARESPAGKSASTRSRRSAVKHKVIVAASRWRTDMIINTRVVKVAT